MDLIQAIWPHLICPGIFLGLILLVVIVSIPHNVRIVRARRKADQVPEQVKRRVLDHLRHAAESARSLTCLIKEPDPTSDVQSIVAASHIGGVPYSEAGDTWPDRTTTAEGEARPATFLLQVRLSDPDLTSLWHGHLIVVFLAEDDFEPIVRGYAMPAKGHYVPLQPRPDNLIPCHRLEAVRTPARIISSERRWPRELRTTIEEELSDYSRDIDAMVTQILCPRAYNYQLEPSNLIFQGGRPMFIQDPPWPECPQCHCRMRFLFQCGDLIPTIMLGDGGVLYVFGCDDHRDEFAAWIESH